MNYVCVLVALTAIALLLLLLAVYFFWRVVLACKQLFDCIVEKEEPTMILNEQEQEQFEAVARPLIEWLNSLPHPHVTAVVDCTSAELCEGVCNIMTMDYVRD